MLGLPINMDGTRRSARAIDPRLRPQPRRSSPTFPIAFWDERLSTAAVERALIAADASRAKRKAVIDQHAAVYILQGALDRLASNSLKSPLLAAHRDGRAPFSERVVARVQLNVNFSPLRQRALQSVSPMCVDVAGAVERGVLPLKAVRRTLR